MKEVIFGRRPFDTELIIFDKDGTLTDFRKTWFPILEKRLQILTRKLGLQEMEREFRNLTYRRFGIDEATLNKGPRLPDTLAGSVRVHQAAIAA